MINLSGQTTVYGIIGSPVAHSLSPLFQNHFIDTVGIDAAYLPFLVQPENLKDAIQGLHAAHIQGLNVTVPHKEKILPWVNADTDAMTIGAVNTLKHTPSGWDATNTDWQGFASVLQGLQANVSQTPVLLFGAGGTARAICHALHKQGAKDIWLCNRSPERAKRLADELNQTYTHTHIHTLTWDQSEITDKLKLCRVIINSSSIGLNEDDVFPFVLDGYGVAIDAVYKPSGKTAFTKAASEHYQTVDGLPMLIAQGIFSFAFWHQSQPFKLPNKLDSLQWVEKQLSRKHLKLLGWRASA